MAITLYPNLLIREPSQDEQVRKAQWALAWQMDGYTDATAEVSKFINKLYREKHPQASLVHEMLKPLTESQNKRFDEMCEYANDEEQLKKDLESEGATQETREEEKTGCYWCGDTCCGENGVFFETKGSGNKRLQSLSINSKESTIDVELYINDRLSKSHIEIKYCPNCGRRLEAAE